MTWHDMAWNGTYWPPSVKCERLWTLQQYAVPESSEYNFYLAMRSMSSWRDFQRQHPFVRPNSRYQHHNITQHMLCPNWYGLTDCEAMSDIAIWNLLKSRYPVLCLITASKVDFAHLGNHFDSLGLVAQLHTATTWLHTAKTQLHKATMAVIQVIKWEIQDTTTANM